MREERENYETLLWPICDFAFVKMDLTHRMQKILYALCTAPGLYVPEIVDAIILVAFIAMLVRQKKTCAFIGNGQA